MIALWLALALAEPAADYRSHLDQAALFLRRGWTADAIAELERAVAHPDGRLDPDAWHLLATTRLSIADVGGARLAAEQALTHARTADEAARGEELVRYLAEGFGELRLTGPADGPGARVELELRSLVLDARAQEIADAIRELGRRKAPLPRRFTVPAGTWAVDGVELEIPANDTVNVAARPGGVAGWIDRAEIELGTGLAGVQGVDGLLPGPLAHAAIGWTVGPIELAATGAWAPRPHRRRDGVVATEPGGGGVGLRLGLPVPELAPWVVRPALTARLVWVPGIELGCERAAADAFSCTPGGPADLLLYGTARAIAPGAALTVARIPRDRPFAVGLGLDGAAEALFGALAADGTATRLSDGSAVRYSVEPAGRRVLAVGWSTTFAVFIAL